MTTTLRAEGGSNGSALAVTDVVRREMEGTPWARRLVRQPITATWPSLKGVEVLMLRAKENV